MKKDIDQKSYFLDLAESYHQHDILLETREIVLGSEIDEASAIKTIKNIQLLNFLDKTQPIQLLLSSPGGDTYWGMALYDLIKISPAPVIITATGFVASAATIVLQAAHIRQATPETVFLVHDGAMAYEGDPKGFENWAKRTKLERQIMYQIYAKRTEKSVKFWEKRCAVDNLFDVQTALKLNFIDKILIETKK